MIFILRTKVVVVVVLKILNFLVDRQERVIRRGNNLVSINKQSISFWHAVDFLFFLATNLMKTDFVRMLDECLLSEPTERFVEHNKFAADFIMRNPQPSFENVKSIESHGEMEGNRPNHLEVCESGS